MGIVGLLRQERSTTARAGVSQDYPAPLIIAPRTWLEIGDQPYHHHAGTAPSGLVSNFNRNPKLHSAAQWSSTESPRVLPPSRTLTERPSDNGDVFVRIERSVWTSPTPQRAADTAQHGHLGTSAPVTTLVHCRPSEFRFSLALTFRENLSIFFFRCLMVATIRHRMPF